MKKYRCPINPCPIDSNTQYFMKWHIANQHQNIIKDLKILIRKDLFTELPMRN